jgi:hypothetical protein
MTLLIPFVALLLFLIAISVRFAVRQQHGAILDELMNEIGAADVIPIWFDGRRAMWRGLSIAVRFGQPPVGRDYALAEINTASAFVNGDDPPLANAIATTITRSSDRLDLAPSRVRVRKTIARNDDGERRVALRAAWSLAAMLVERMNRPPA